MGLILRYLPLRYNYNNKHLRGIVLTSLLSFTIKLSYSASATCWHFPPDTYFCEGSPISLSTTVSDNLRIQCGVGTICPSPAFNFTITPSDFGSGPITQSIPFAIYFSDNAPKDIQLKAEFTTGPIRPILSADKNQVYLAKVVSSLPVAERPAIAFTLDYTSCGTSSSTRNIFTTNVANNPSNLDIYNGASCNDGSDPNSCTDTLQSCTNNPGALKVTLYPIERVPSGTYMGSVVLTATQL